MNKNFSRFVQRLQSLIKNLYWLPQRFCLGTDEGRAPWGNWLIEVDVLYYCNQVNSDARKS